MYEPEQVKERILSLADKIVAVVCDEGLRPCENDAAIQIASALLPPTTPLKVYGVSPDEEQRQVELLESLR